ncbi:FAD dependent oxidoreductase [Xylariomycetidae sp. FL2044]|nr:FAD dependent oxidoreductase [Xylariomycetidae sp. FL2044]
MSSTMISSPSRLLAAASLFTAFGIAKCVRSDTIERDVVIVGGGASGAHAAVRLKDQNYTVAVVEKNSLLGGHTKAYTDPATGKVLNIGVQAWMDYGDIQDFVHRMGVDTDGSMSFTTLTTNYVDLSTGEVVEGYSAPADADMYAAIQKYVDVITAYENMTLPGYFGFPAAGEIPEDLTMPFGEFVEKYGIQAAVPQLWTSTLMGLGDLMNVPTLYVIAGSPLPMAKALLGTAAAIVPSTGRLYDLFDSITEYLGTDVLYSSTVTSSTREAGADVELTVTSADGTVTTIRAKRLLISIEPTADNLAPFALDETEHAVFDKFKFTTTFAGLVRHPSLAISNGYTNTDPEAPSGNYTIYPLPAQIGSMNYIGDTEDLFQMTAVGTVTDTAETMQELVNESIDNMVSTGLLSASADGVTASFPAFEEHGLMHSHVTTEDLLDGFITKQIALQGYRNTWYTGAAWSAGMTTTLWVLNDELLPMMLEGM